MQAPTLQTERLVLRPTLLSDFEAYAAFLSSDRAQYMDGPLSRDSAWTWFTNDTAHWQLFGFGGLMIETPDGAVAGQVAVTQGIAFPEPELGWFLYDGFEGKGFASEAAIALRKWVYDFAGLTTVVSYVSPENLGSARVAQRMGGVRDVNAPLPAGETAELTHVYRHPSADQLGDGGMEAYA